MNTLKTCLGAAAGFVVLTLAFTLTESGRAAAQGMKPLLVLVSNTAAEPVPVTTVVPAADRVLLEFRGGSDPCPAPTLPLSRILPDGTVENAFSVPAGRMLVLTDLEGIIRQDPNLTWTAGQVGSLNVLASTQFPRTFLRAYGPFTSEAVSMGMVFMSTHAESGVVVGPLFNICVSANVNFPNGGGVADVTQARVHGYLISE